MDLLENENILILIIVEEISKVYGKSFIQMELLKHLVIIETELKMVILNIIIMKEV